MASWSCATAPEAPETADLVLDAPDCAPLEGMYRISYAKKNGDCADLPEQLARFTDRPSSSALSSKCEGSVEISEDQCDREEDAVCPVSDDTGATIGQASLVTTFSQSAERHIEGMATLRLSTDAGIGCTATYYLIGEKVE
jgi:hypothetical protein